MKKISKKKIEELENKYDVKITSNEKSTQFSNYRYCVCINDDSVSVKCDNQSDKESELIDGFIDCIEPTDELEDIIETFIYHFYGEIEKFDADVFENDEHKFTVDFNYNLRLVVDKYGATLYWVDNDCNFFEVETEETDLESGETNDRYERIEVIKKFLKKFGRE